MELTSEAIELHRSSLVIDLHADTTIPMKWVGYRIEKKHSPLLSGRLGFFHCDIPRFREGGYKGQFLVLGTFPYPEKGCFQSCLKQAELIRKRIEENSSDLELVTTAKDFLEAHQKGRIAILLGVEGGHNLEADMDNVQRFFNAGVRYIGLAHFTKNRICAPSGGVGMSASAPLTDFGHEVVHEMNRIGMMIDLAHVGRQAFLNVAKISTKPVIVSHTGISSVRPLWRNIDDDQIKAVAEKEGVIGIIFSWRYICRGRRGGLEDLLSHFEYVRRLVGVKHLAIGSDFDGAVVPVRGLEDASQLPRITQTFLNAGWREDEIRGVLGENILRVLKANEAPLHFS